MAGRLPDLGAWRPEDWAALGTCVTAVVAIVAGVVAGRQLREARRLRLEQAQPYVVAYMADTPHHERFVDLVLRNFGTTAAVDVRLVVTPAPRQSRQGDKPADLFLPDCIPVLVPGQEWRTFWDFAPLRVQAGLPERHEAAVSYTDSRGEAYTFRSVLDWASLRGRTYITTSGLHEAATALQNLDQTAKSWRESIHGGLAVWVRDGHAEDQQDQERASALEAAWAKHTSTADTQPPPAGAPPETLHPAPPTPASMSEAPGDRRAATTARVADLARVAGRRVARWRAGRAERRPAGKVGTRGADR